MTLSTFSYAWNSKGKIIIIIIIIIIVPNVVNVLNLKWYIFYLIKNEQDLQQKYDKLSSQILKLLRNFEFNEI